MAAVIILCVAMALTALTAYLVRPAVHPLTIAVLAFIAEAVVLALLLTSGHPIGTHLAGGAWN